MLVIHKLSRKENSGFGDQVRVTFLIASDCPCHELRTFVTGTAGIRGSLCVLKIGHNQLSTWARALVLVSFLLPSELTGRRRWKQGVSGLRDLGYDRAGAEQQPG